MSSTVLVIGDVMTDIVVRPEGALIQGGDRRAAIRVMPGGSAANAAAWLAGEGIGTLFAGRVGAADLERQDALLVESGVKPRLAADPTLPTGTIVTILAPDGERSFYTDRGANDLLCRADLPDALLDGADFVHISGYALVAPGPRTAVRELLAEARRRGVELSIDPPSHPFLAELGPAFLDWTEGAELLCLNAAEAGVLAGTEDREAQLTTLTARYPIVVIKQGAAGAKAARAG